MVIPKILKCHHVFCFACIAKYFLEFKQTCPICLATICLKEMRTIQIETVACQTGDPIKFVLMKKNLKNYKVEFFESPISPNDNFLNKVHCMSVEDFETMIFGEIAELHNNPNLSEIDSLVLDFCQFIDLKSIEKHHEFHAPPCIGKRTLACSNKTLKEDFTYFYQDKEGVNVFMHPVDFSYLLKHYESVENLPRVLDCSIEGVQKLTQNTYYRKLWPQLSHVSLNFDMEIVRTDLTKLVPDFNAKEYQKSLNALLNEIDSHEKVHNASTKKNHQVWRKLSRHNETQGGEGHDRELKPHPAEDVVFMRPKNGKDGFDRIIQKDKVKGKKKPGYIWKTDVTQTNNEAFELFEIVNSMQETPHDPSFLKLVDRSNSTRMEDMFPELSKAEKLNAEEESSIFSRLKAHNATVQIAKPKPKAEPEPELPTHDSEPGTQLTSIVINKVKKKPKSKYSNMGQMHN